MDELDLPDTRALFLESGAAALEDAKAKEMQEYLDAVNKEVIALAGKFKFLSFQRRQQRWRPGRGRGRRRRRSAGAH